MNDTFKLSPEKLRKAVSDHALVRWIERVHDFSLDEFRQAIVDRDVYAALKSGATRYTCDGVEYVMDRGRIITVIAGQPKQIKSLEDQNTQINSLLRRAVKLNKDMMPNGAFEARIRADERERCAKVADNWTAENQFKGMGERKRFSDADMQSAARTATKLCAQDIRAMNGEGK